MVLEQLVGKASDDELDEKTVLNYCTKESLSEFADSFSKVVVNGYDTALYDFTFCDSAMNWLYGFMTDPTFLESGNNTIPEYALEAYLAFDTGDVDPVKKYTNPAIRSLANGNKNS